MTGERVPRRVAGAVVATAAVVLVVGSGGLRPTLPTLLAAGGLVVAVGAAVLATARLGGGTVEDERHARPPLPCRGCGGMQPRSRRAVLLAAGVAALVVATGGLGWLLRASRRAERALAGTAWRPGVRLVDERGRVVTASSLSPGAVATVWPEGHLKDDDAQAVLIHLRPDQVISGPGRDDWTAGGFVAYSKLCTHMGCPVGLYQEEANVLVCPCHQAAFDILRGARPILGPAHRPLPQLPLRIDEEEDVLVAGGDFSGAVGASYWSRPR